MSVERNATAPHLRLAVFAGDIGASTTKCYRQPRKQCPSPGYDIEIFEAVMRVLGWTYEYAAESKIAGSLIDTTLSNGTASSYWSGLIGMAADNEVDMVASTLLMKESRRRVVDYSYPVVYYHNVFLYLMDRGSVQSNHIMLRSVDSVAWLSLLALLMLVAVAKAGYCTIATQTTPALQGHRKDNVNLLFRQLWNTLAEFFVEFYHDVTPITVVWVWGALLITTYYKTVFCSQRAIILMPKPLLTSSDQLPELLADGKYRLVYSNNQTFPHCHGETCGKIRSILKQYPVRIRRDLQYGNEISFGTELIGLAPGDVSIKEHSNNKAYYYVRDMATESNEYGAFVFPRGSAHRRAFNAALQAGVLAMTGRVLDNGYMAAEKVGRAPARNAYSQASKIALTMAHYRELFTLYLLLVVLSSFVFFAELVVSSKTKRKHTV